MQGPVAKAASFPLVELLDSGLPVDSSVALLRY